MAWWLPPLALLIAAIIFIFGDNSTSRDGLTNVTTLSSDLTLVTVGERSTTKLDLDAELSRNFVSPDAVLVERLLQNLRLFRADFRQMAPSITVSAKPGSPERDRIATELGGLLARAELGQRGQTTDVTAEHAELNPGIIFYSTRQNREILLRFINDIAPYFKGTVLLAGKDDGRLDRIAMVIHGQPGFLPDGSVVFTTHNPAQ
jgi:hypothetical protein